MRIVQVVHGYPPRYNAGSEVYTQTLSRSLANRHQVMVFTRFEDPFLPPYAEKDELDAGDPGIPPIPLRLINIPHFRDRYRHQAVDESFARCLDDFTPEIVHIQHLGHLSSSLVKQASLRSIPVVFTLHDFWLMCPRGQFLQFFPTNPDDPFALCDGQEDRKCATHCCARHFSGAPDDEPEDVRYYTEWIRRRMQHMREICTMVDMFITPSKQLRRRFVEEFSLPIQRVEHLDYGFDLRRLSGWRRAPRADGGFVFGYIGTHVPAKGIHHLLDAFARLNDNARLRIWGRPHAETTPALMQIHNRLPASVRQRISWEGEYANEDIVRAVFNQVDAIVVPSIWLENSPLVIHEAQQARVPVITANAGGMAELVHHEVNGLLFEHRNPASLAGQMSRLLNDPALATRLGERGYLHDPDGNIPSTEQLALKIEALYTRLFSPNLEVRQEVPI
jgi:glycosyltransferase involved in cell wall biosynthesis